MVTRQEQLEKKPLRTDFHYSKEGLLVVRFSFEKKEALRELGGVIFLIGFGAVLLTTLPEGKGGYLVGLLGGSIIGLGIYHFWKVLMYGFGHLEVYLSQQGVQWHYYWGTIAVGKKRRRYWDDIQRVHSIPVYTGEQDKSQGTDEENVNIEAYLTHEQEGYIRGILNGLLDDKKNGQLHLASDWSEHLMD